MLHAFIDRTLILTGWSDAIWFLLLPKPRYLMLPGMKYWGLKKKKKIIIIIIIIIIINAKCELIYNGFNECSHPAFSGFIRIDSDDATLLGSPLCSGNGLTAALTKKCDDLQRAMSRLHLVGSHYAFCIVRNCISVPTLMHILRTSRCFDNGLLHRFDSILRDGLVSSLNVAFSHSQWQQACLPVADGGLGVRSAFSLASSAFLASAVSTLALQNLILPRIADKRDTAFDDCLEFWSNATSAAPLAEPACHKQRAWDRFVVCCVKESRSHCTLNASLLSTALEC